MPLHKEIIEGNINESILARLGTVISATFPNQRTVLILGTKETPTNFKWISPEEPEIIEAWLVDILDTLKKEREIEKDAKK